MPIRYADASIRYAGIVLRYAAEGKSLS